MSQSLYEQIHDFVSEENHYPMHMPGHKRRIMPVPGLPYDIDVTEVETWKQRDGQVPGGEPAESSTDDLHKAEGILKKAMERAAGVFGSRRTWFLVNGSTCGILAAVRSCCPFGSEIIAARNCHKSVYHAIELGHLKPHWIWPQIHSVYEIACSIEPAAVEQELSAHPGAGAVIITSPTYEGVVSDIESISQICHRYGVPLIVDEAHGAHFGLFSAKNDAADAGKAADGLAADAGKAADGLTADAGKAADGLTEEAGTTSDVLAAEDGLENAAAVCFPDSAVHLGADIVIQSAHKTLPSLTQTAFLHIGSRAEYADEQEIERQLDIFETSSPSYPLMISLDGCVQFLTRGGEAAFRTWQQNLGYFNRRMHDGKNNGVLLPGHGTDLSGNGGEDGRIFALDSSKILIHCEPGFGFGAAQLAAELQEQCGIVPEMVCGRNVLLMTGCGDPPAIYEKMAAALTAVREMLPETGEPADDRNFDGAGESADDRDFDGTGEPADDRNFDGAGESADDRDFDGTGERDSRKDTEVQESVDRGRTEEDESLNDRGQVSSRRDRAGEAPCRNPGIEEAARAAWEVIPMAAAEGRICAEYIYPYPPGVPILIPGESVTGQAVRMMEALSAAGTELRKDKSAEGSMIAVLLGENKQHG